MQRKWHLTTAGWMKKMQETKEKTRAWAQSRSWLLLNLTQKHTEVTVNTECFNNNSRNTTSWYVSHLVPSTDDRSRQKNDNSRQRTQAKQCHHRIDVPFFCDVKSPATWYTHSDVPCRASFFWMTSLASLSPWFPQTEVVSSGSSLPFNVSSSFLCFTSSLVINTPDWFTDPLSTSLYCRLGADTDTKLPPFNTQKQQIKN